MGDPLSIIAIGAAVGGVAGKFVEKAWDSGEKWLRTYFEGHIEIAKDHAKKNSLDFLNELGRRVDELDKKAKLTQLQLQLVSEHPDFSVLLQKALISASQTDSNEKHKLLARIVSERIRAQDDSILTLSSKLACDAISYANSRQLKILGFIATVMTIVPDKSLSNEAFQRWLEDIFRPYIDLSVGPLDLLHLETLSCTRSGNNSLDDLVNLFHSKNAGDYNSKILWDMSIYQKVFDLWDGDLPLRFVGLTTVGEVIGVYVSDLLTNGTTEFNEWFRN